MKPLVLAAAGVFSVAANAQLVISDHFNVTGGSSASYGFGSDGVNTEIAGRLSGQAAIDQTLSYVQSRTDKVASAFFIDNNKVRIDSAANPGVFEFSADGVQAFDFGAYLRGKVYEIVVTMDNDTIDSTNRRFTIGLGSSSAQFVQDMPLGIQLQADANQTGSQIFKRVDAASSPGGVDVNTAIASGLTFGDPVEIRIVVTDVDTTYGLNSSYEIYLNGGASPIDSGSFGIPSEKRHLLFDIAPDAGPVTFDDFSLTVTGDAPEPPVIGARDVYFVGNNGEIRGFTGIATGDVPITSASKFNQGVLEATHAEYGSYQAFAFDPTTGIVYGVNGSGDVVRWPTVGDWITNTNAIVPGSGDPGYEVYGADLAQGSVHGASYDPNTGGFYVVYEGDASIDGDIGAYATADDFLNNTNAVVEPSSYGGNLLNFYYFGDDAPGNLPAPNDIAGARYFHATGTGSLEGFQSLAAYDAGGGNRTFEKTGGFCVDCVAAFAIPLPVVSDLGLKITGVTRNGLNEVTEVTLEFSAQAAASYSILSSPDLVTPFTVVPGYDNVVSSPVTLSVPAGFETRGFFRMGENP